MALVTVQILLEEPLKCGKCDSLFIKLNDPSLLLVNDGVPVEDIKQFITGEVVEFEEVSPPGSCDIVYRYTLQYDDALLLDPGDPLDACDIERVCCADCLLEFILELDFTHTLVSPECGQLVFTTPTGDVNNITILTCANLPITGDGTSGNPLDILISADPNNILTLGGDSGLYVTAHIVETITTLVDNVDNTFTYTSEDATVTIFDAAHQLSEPVARTVRLTRPDGTFDDVPLDFDHTLTEPVENTVRLTRPDGTFDEVIISGDAETITTLVDNTNNSFTYTSEDATVTVFDAEHSFTSPVANTFRLTRPNGDFQEASVIFPAEHDSSSFAVGFVDTATPWAFTNAAPFLSDIAGPLIISAPASRGMLFRVEYSFRPNYIFEPSEDSQITVEVQVSEDLAAFATISSFLYRMLNPAGTSQSLTFPISESMFHAIAAGGSKNLRARLRVTSPNPAVTSQIAGITGGLSAFGSTTDP